MKDSFWEMAYEMPLGASIPVKSTVEDDNHKYQTLFEDNHEGIWLLESPRSLLRMRIKNGPLPWLELWLESNTQSNQSYDV